MCEFFLGKVSPCFEWGEGGHRNEVGGKVENRKKEEAERRGGLEFCGLRYVETYGCLSFT